MYLLTYTDKQGRRQSLKVSTALIDNTMAYLRSNGASGFGWKFLGY